MHELSLAQEIVDQATSVAKEHDAAHVVTITVKIGPLSGVYKDSLEFCFPVCAENTRAAGAKLIIEEVPLLLRCATCGQESSPHPIHMKCALCQSSDVEVISGREFKIVHMEIE